MTKAEMIALQTENAQLRAELEALRKDAEWISVEDRLPEDYLSVLAIDSYGEEFIGFTTKDSKLWIASTEHVWGGGDIDSQVHNVTYWRPLPPAPDRAMKG